MIEVSIIIVNYNTLQITAECIDSIFRFTTNVNFEVILVDNGSIDGSEQHFASDDRITYIYLKENIGFGRANNEGVKYATGRNILFLNSDTLLQDNSVKLLSEYLDHNNTVGACGANLFDSSMQSSISFYRQYPSIFDNFITLNKLYNKIRFKDSVTFNNTQNPLDVCHISGADLMIKKKILDHIGSFDPQFFMYFEDTELCYRIKRAGFLLMSVPSARIIHLQGRSTMNSIKFIWWLNSKIKFYKSVGKSKTYIRTDLIINKFHLIYQTIRYYTNKELCNTNKMMISEINKILVSDIL
ncbi:MAG: glycosyltransferase family 2 protein [Prevotellaceae bacterium]|nr:glycosyltransferase family 2 protein [Candidatus Colivivens equi]